MSSQIFSTNNFNCTNVQKVEKATENFLISSRIENKWLILNYFCCIISTKVSAALLSCEMVIRKETNVLCSTYTLNIVAPKESGKGAWNQSTKHRSSSEELALRLRLLDFFTRKKKTLTAGMRHIPHHHKQTHDRKSAFWHHNHHQPSSMAG